MCDIECELNHTADNLLFSVPTVDSKRLQVIKGPRLDSVSRRKMNIWRVIKNDSGLAIIHSFLMILPFNLIFSEVSLTCQTFLLFSCYFPKLIV